MGLLAKTKEFLWMTESDDEFLERISLKKKNYENKLTKEQCEYLKNINFNDEIINRYEMGITNIKVAVSIGVLVGTLAILVDKNGKNIEGAINKIRIKNEGNVISIKEFDTNNVFDIKMGKNHRSYIGHDFNFLLKIPDDYMLQNGETAREYINNQKPDDYMLQNEETDKEYINNQKKEIQFYDLMKKRYNLPDNILKAIPYILKITIVHMIKDLVTDEGIPIPFTSIATKFKKNLKNVCGYSNSNKINEILGDELGHIKFSDITSCLVIKKLINIYLKSNYESLDKHSEKVLRSQFSIIAYTTIIIFQLLILIFGKYNSKKNNIKKYINGSNFNKLIFKNLIYNYMVLSNEMKYNKKHMLCTYKNQRTLIGGIFMEEDMKQYSSEADEEYYFENDGKYYLDKDILDKVYNMVLESENLDEKSKEQLIGIYNLELLKWKLANKVVDIYKYREELIKVLKSYSHKYCMNVFENTCVKEKFYLCVNKFYEV